jgi:hypothetical protein
MSPTINTTYPSLNHSSRNGRPISMLVLHATVGELASSLSWLTSRISKASSHYVISKDGTVYQLVDDSLAAWHAGKSAWNGLDSEQIQDRSLGIELENDNTGHDPYGAAQLEALTWLARQKITQYRIERSLLVRHLDIAIPPGRKTDPAGFPWKTWTDQLYVPIDPLRQHTIEGPSGKILYCGDGFYKFYYGIGRGPALLGLALSDETRDGDVTFMRFERCIMKYSAQYGVELALLAEAKTRGWL